MEHKSEENLNGKVAVITGASSGIGKSIAKALAESGVKVCLGARRLEKIEELKKEIESMHVGSKTAIAVQVDVVNKQQVKHLIERAEKELGPVDILINNAGVMPLTYMKNIREEDWEQTIDVNVKGVLHGVGAVLKQMLQRKTGDIVNISSDAGRKVFPGGAVYCASKWAVEAITQGLRLELAESGVRFLSVQPGAVQTELATCIKDSDVLSAPSHFGKDFKFLQPEDIARAVVFGLKTPRHASMNEILIRPEMQHN